VLVRLRRLLLVGVVMLALAAGLLFSLSPPVYAIDDVNSIVPGHQDWESIPLVGSIKGKTNPPNRPNPLVNSQSRSSSMTRALWK